MGAANLMLKASKLGEESDARNRKRSSSVFAPRSDGASDRLAPKDWECHRLRREECRVDRVGLPLRDAAINWLARSGSVSCCWQAAWKGRREMRPFRPLKNEYE